MLILSRKRGEELVLNGTIRITVLSVSGNRVKLGVAAPADVTVWRDVPPPHAVATRPLVELPAASEGQATVDPGPAACTPG